MLSDNFLQLVKNVLTETVRNDNIDIYIGPKRDDYKEHYRDITKWSDFRILIPTLFNFFHGIELLLKAAIYKKGIPERIPRHHLSDIFDEFKTEYPHAFAITSLLDKYIYPVKSELNMLKKFYIENQISDSSQFYEIYKYPYSRNLKVEYNYFELRNLDNEGISFFKQIILDIQKIREKTNEL